MDVNHDGLQAILVVDICGADNHGVKVGLLGCQQSKVLGNTSFQAAQCSHTLCLCQDCSAKVQIKEMSFSSKLIVLTDFLLSFKV